MAGLLLVYTAYLERSLPRRWAYILGAAAFFFAAGEEITWGQRLLGWTTPDFLMGLNQQGETNFHNLDTRLFGRLHEQGTILLCAVTAAAHYYRKGSLFGISLPSIPLLLGFLLMRLYALGLGYSFGGSLIVIEYGLLLLLCAFALVYQQPRWFILATATLMLGPALFYAYDLRDVQPNANPYEVYEYLLGLACLLYALELLLAQRGKGAGSTQPGVSWKLPGGRIELWLAACAALVAIGGVLAVWNQIQTKNEAADRERSWQSIDSGESVALLRSNFDFHIIGNRLVYIREPCAQADLPESLRTGIHVFPVDADDLSRGRKRFGYDDRRHFTYRNAYFSRAVGSSEERCLASITLPDYPIAHIRIIQKRRDSNGVWYNTAETTIRHPDDVARQADLLEGARSVIDASESGGEPITDGAFEVHFDRGERRLIYARTPCADVDVAARFFLHVLPVDLDDLPGDRKPSGFVNLDFDFHQSGLFSDGQCVAWRELPDFDIARIRTGQYTKEGQIWLQEISLR